MAITKQTLASAFYIRTTGSTTVNYAPAVRAEVLTNVLPITYSTSSTLGVPTGAGLIPPRQVTRPGIFTAGTAPEGTLSNPTNDSNG